LDDEKPGQTLQATALVHEACIRLISSGEQQWNRRGHFLVPLPRRCAGFSSNEPVKKFGESRGGELNTAIYFFLMPAGREHEALDFLMNLNDDQFVRYLRTYRFRIVRSCKARSATIFLPGNNYQKRVVIPSVTASEREMSGELLLNSKSREKT
jgi:hypothetical protein